jgi:hypothetical protein
MPDVPAAAASAALSPFTSNMAESGQNHMASNLSVDLAIFVLALLLASGTTLVMSDR